MISIVIPYYKNEKSEEYLKRCIASIQSQSYKDYEIVISEVVGGASKNTNAGVINGYSFEFRKDGSYLFENGSVLGRSQFRGKYKIKDSLIFLDKNEIDNVVKTNQLAIRYISDNINGKNKVIVQIDKKHNRIEDKYFDFVINIDKR